ncbi:hypothetical protein GQ607_010421 [Colletotrichum asianum]|uniref:NACHT domain-containing protein n=1 Tax=Colletotrichum asianum TaxID=702518 RepID=A0A8H3WA53_9PEZI|nr:hypothetical protein GQ607_010421 [Colletotrichum asianum]
MDVSCDTSQVIAFTAGLDVVDPNRRGRSIATRLHSILETVQRFSEVVGIYVSSHPEIAALVWGSVRLAFTVLANFTSFFQTFSELLNGFDTLLPQFKEYQVLFPDSLPLRNSVYDFHSAIISCCTQVISSTRRTWSQQAWASFTSSFESEIRPRVAEIREKAELVKSQAALAKAQDDTKQRKWSSLLLRLSSYKHETAFNNALGEKHRGTAEWIFSTRQFQDWLESADSSVLNVSGKIGSGKTVLSANLISYLSQNLPPRCSVSYLFVRIDDEESRQANAILRSLIFQALTGYKAENRLMVLLEKSASHSFERGSLLSLLGHFISLFEKTYLVVDGFDQCPQHEQHSLLEIFSNLMQMNTGSGAVKILISARESTTKDIDRALAPTKHLRTGFDNTNADLARDETLMDEIMDKLRTGGEGMFLWVFYSVEDICSCARDDDIRQTLKVLPRALSDTFDRALGRILSFQPLSKVDIIQEIFKWVAAVRRPVTRWELGEALGVKILQGSSIKDQIVNGTERIPEWCENLIQIEPGDETVRFFHHSIKTHLLEMMSKAELDIFHVDLKAWDHHIGEVCVTYLNFSDFERALTEFSPNTSSFLVRQIAMSSEGRSIPGAVRKQASLNALPFTLRYKAARLLRRFSKSKRSGESLSAPEDGCTSEDVSKFFNDYPFLLYATTYWFHHTSYFLQNTTKTWKLWKDRVTKSMFEDEESWADFGPQPPGFETFESTSWLAGQGDLLVAASAVGVSEMEDRRAERVMLHKAIIFADFIAHEALLNHVLTTIVDRGHKLQPRDENSHDGLISLIIEFVASGGGAEEKQHLGFDAILLQYIAHCKSLTSNLRSRAISIAIPEVPEKDKPTANFEIRRAVRSVYQTGARVDLGSRHSTTYSIVRLNLTLSDALSSEAKQAWSEPYPEAEKYMEEGVFESLHDLAYPVDPSAEPLAEPLSDPSTP